MLQSNIFSFISELLYKLTKETNYLVHNLPSQVRPRIFRCGRAVDWVGEGCEGAGERIDRVTAGDPARPGSRTALRTLDL